MYILYNCSWFTDRCMCIFSTACLYVYTVEKVCCVRCRVFVISMNHWDAGVWTFESRGGSLDQCVYKYIYIYLYIEVLGGGRQLNVALPFCYLVFSGWGGGVLLPFLGGSFSARSSVDGPWVSPCRSSLCSLRLGDLDDESCQCNEGAVSCDGSCDDQG